MLTWGSETSQYPEEKKTNPRMRRDSLSSGERKERSPNLSTITFVKVGEGCRTETERKLGESKNLLLDEATGKLRHRG